jgi:hypothetical protein
MTQTISNMASRLGKLAKGKPKTGLSRAERKRRSELAKANLARINGRKTLPK